MTVYISGILIACGLFFFLVGSIGMIRLPDFYSRLHAAGIIDTMGLLLSMSGLAILVLNEITLGNFLSALKIIFIVVFVFLTSPTATHAIVDAGIRAGLKPWQKNNI
ncbi:MAG: monovalent cation/H(+) antiporter subunit G [Desulfamplus sp.]|nr:monovalent cation/H(+) antiporter subunit G [Desulfamplus sp.]